MSVTIYGSSDDLIEIEGDIREEFYALTDLDDGNFTCEGGLLAFSDGTVLRIVYANAVWRITPVVAAGEVNVVQAPENDDDDYSDHATVEGEIHWVVLGSKVATRP